MNEQFQLPDGTMVGTGNIAPEAPRMLYAELPENLLLDNDEIERMLPAGFYEGERAYYRKWMINQGQIGKCNTSAAVGAEYRIREIQGYEHVALADNHLYWRINGGKDRGSMLDDGMLEVESRGVCRRVLDSGTVPHNAVSERDVSDQMRTEANQDGPNYRTHEPWRIPLGANFARAIASCLARRYPIIMAWHVGNNSMRLQNGYAQQGRGPGNHASFFHCGKFVGGQDIVHPDLCNSWGPVANELYGSKGGGWGEGGFGLMTMDGAEYCCQNHAFYAITSAHDNTPVLT